MAPSVGKGASVLGRMGPLAETKTARGQRMEGDTHRKSRAGLGTVTGPSGLKIPSVTEPGTAWNRWILPSWCLPFCLEGYWVEPQPQPDWCATTKAGSVVAFSKGHRCGPVGLACPRGKGCSGWHGARKRSWLLRARLPRRHLGCQGVYFWCPRKAISFSLVRLLNAAGLHIAK